jgi:hypothetical protein
MKAGPIKYQYQPIKQRQTRPHTSCCTRCLPIPYYPRRFPGLQTTYASHATTQSITACSITSCQRSQLLHMHRTQPSNPGSCSCAFMHANPPAACAPACSTSISSCQRSQLHILSTHPSYSGSCRHIDPLPFSLPMHKNTTAACKPYS